MQFIISYLYKLFIYKLSGFRSFYLIRFTGTWLNNQKFSSIMIKINFLQILLFRISNKVSKK